MYPAKPIAASNASKIMLSMLSFRCSNGDGHFAVAVPVFVCQIANDAASEFDLRIAVKRKAHQTTNKQTTARLGHDPHTASRNLPSSTFSVALALAWALCNGHVDPVHAQKSIAIGRWWPMLARICVANDNRELAGERQNWRNVVG